MTMPRAFAARALRRRRWDRCDRGGRSTQRGVTLIELITVMVVLAILASIAIPSYRSYLLRAQRSEATRTLMRIQTAQEKFFAQNNRYADQLSAPSPNGLGIPAITENGFFDIALSPPDGEAAIGDGYKATATPHAGGGQTDDTRCRGFTVDHNLHRTAVDGAGVDVTRECWR